MNNIRIAALQGFENKQGEVVSSSTVLRHTEYRIRAMAGYGAKIVCLSELFHCAPSLLEPKDYSEQDCKSIQNTMQKLAVDCKIAIVCPSIEKEGEKYFNTAFFIEADGQISGKYRKIHPTEDEMKSGIVPGAAEPVVIDFAGMKVGCQICFDANWPQEWVNLKIAGAQMIFFCSAFSAEKLIEAYATILRVPMVAATWCPDCRIYDRLGRLIAHQSPYYDFAMVDLLINQPVYHLDYQIDKVEKIRTECSDVSVEIMNGRGTWLLNGDLESIRRTAGKYDLIDVDDYLRRAEMVQKSRNV